MSPLNLIFKGLCMCWHASANIGRLGLKNLYNCSKIKALFGKYMRIIRYNCRKTFILPVTTDILDK